jgi:hypothetical protein
MCRSNSSRLDQPSQKIYLGNEVGRHLQHVRDQPNRTIATRASAFELATIATSAANGGLTPDNHHADGMIHVAAATHNANRLIAENTRFDVCSAWRRSHSKGYISHSHGP